MKALPTNVTLVIEYAVKQVNAYTSNLVAKNTVAIPSEVSTITNVLLQPQTAVTVLDVKQAFNLISWSPVNLVLTVNSVSLELQCNGTFIYTGVIDEIIISNPTNDVINMQYVAC